MVAPPSKCSKELANAVYDDFKRKAIDAAKKRAVAQGVDFETFQNMVSVAHLRPLQAPSLMAHGQDAPSWAFAADGRRVRADEAQAHAASRALLSDALPPNPPSSSGEFARDWRRCCPTPDHKYRYLQYCGPEGLGRVFKVEISSELLKDVLSVLSTCWLGHAGAAQEDQNRLGQEQQQQEEEQEQEPAQGAAAQMASGGASASASASAGQPGPGGATTRDGALESALWVARVLEALCGAGRFKLALSLLGAPGKQLISSLLASLREAADAAAAAAPLAPEQEGDEGEGEAPQRLGVARKLSASLDVVAAAFGASAAA